MGFNSVAVILNDYISGGSTDISPGIAWAVQRFPAHDRFDTDFRGGRIVSMAHADHWQPCVVGQNSGYSLHDKEIPAEALASVARALEARGYRVTKRKPKSL